MLCKILRFLLRIADATISVLGDVLELIVDAASDVIEAGGDAVGKLFSGSGGIFLLGGGLLLLMLMSNKDQPSRSYARDERGTVI